MGVTNLSFEQRSSIYGHCLPQLMEPEHVYTSTLSVWARTPFEHWLTCSGARREAPSHAWAREQKYWMSRLRMGECDLDVRRFRLDMNISKLSVRWTKYRLSFLNINLFNPWFNRKAMGDCARESDQTLSKPVFINWRLMSQGPWCPTCSIQAHLQWSV